MSHLCSFPAGRLPPILNLGTSAPGSQRSSPTLVPVQPSRPFQGKRTTTKALDAPKTLPPRTPGHRQLRQSRTQGGADHLGREPSRRDLPTVEPRPLGLWAQVRLPLSVIFLGAMGHVCLPVRAPLISRHCGGGCAGAAEPAPGRAIVGTLGRQRRPATLSAPSREVPARPGAGTEHPPHGRAFASQPGIQFGAGYPVWAGRPVWAR